MDERQMRQALEEIAARNVPAGIDVWPALELRLRRRRPWTFGGQLLRQLVGAGLILAAVALFIAWISSLTQMAIQPTASEATPFSQPVVPADTLVYPEAPATLPRYRVGMVPPPGTVEEALAWTADFRLPDPKLFHDPRSPESLLAVASDGSRLIFPRPSHIVVDLVALVIPGNDSRPAFPRTGAGLRGIGYSLMKAIG